MAANFLVAVRALGQLRHTQGIMGAPGGSAAFGMAAFRIWHDSLLTSTFFLKLAFNLTTGSGVPRMKVSQLAPAIVARI